MDKYLRQIRIVDQEKLRKATVTIIGIGGIGSNAAVYLARAGVGKLRLIDYQKVEPSNLNRQVLYEEEDIGKYKVKVAKEKLKGINSDVQVETFRKEITCERDATELLEGIVIDGLDNFETRMIVNKVCCLKGLPFIHGAVEGFEGRVMTVLPGHACLKCLYVRTPNIKIDTDIIGTAAGIVGCLQANEAIKIICNLGNLLVDKLLVIDLKRMSFDTICVKKDVNCDHCSGSN